MTLDDATTLAAVSSDPQGLLSSITGSVVIDEVQRAPSLFPAIKASVDADRRPGRFLLTGSANVLLVPRISGSLAGRVEIITLWPLSQGDVEGRPERFLDAAFDTRPLATTLAERSGASHPRGRPSRAAGGVVDGVKPEGLTVRFSQRVHRDKARPSRAEPAAPIFGPSGTMEHPNHGPAGPTHGAGEKRIRKAGEVNPWTRHPSTHGPAKRPTTTPRPSSSAPRGAGACIAPRVATRPIVATAAAAPIVAAAWLGSMWSTLYGSWTTAGSRTKSARQKGPGRACSGALGFNLHHAADLRLAASGHAHGRQGRVLSGGDDPRPDRRGPGAQERRAWGPRWRGSSSCPGSARRCRAPCHRKSRRCWG